MKKTDNGKWFVCGNSFYGICDDCGRFVKMNKLFFGSLHFCLTEEEIRQNEEKSNKKTNIT